MKKNILITGKPHSGKSTILRKLIQAIPNKVGFVTNELRDDAGRIGFEIENHLGHKTVLAHVNFDTPQKVSKYSVNIQNLESALPEISSFSDTDVLYIDEIGQMQLFSEKFKELALKFLDSSNTCLAVVSYVYRDPFIEEIKKRDDGFLIELSAENREEKELFIKQLLTKIEKARRYISEPERFDIKGSEVELQSEHGTRKLVFEGGKWKCSCDFYHKYAICSHVIATTEIIKS